MPTYKINKEEQKKVNKGRGDLIQSRPSMAEGDRRAAAAGGPKLLVGSYSERDLSIMESHKAAMDNINRQRADSDAVKHMANISAGRPGVADNAQDPQKKKKYL